MRFWFFCCLEHPNMPKSEDAPHESRISSHKARTLHMRPQFDAQNASMLDTRERVLGETRESATFERNARMPYARARVLAEMQGFPVRERDFKPRSKDAPAQLQARTPNASPRFLAKMRARSTRFQAKMRMLIQNAKMFRTRVLQHCSEFSVGM